MHILRAMSLTVLTWIVLSGCKTTEQSPATVPVAAVPTQALQIPTVSMTPLPTATPIPSNTPTQGLTPTAGLTSLPPTQPATLILATSTPPPTVAILGAVNFVDGTVNLREGPGQQFKVLKSVKAGTPLVVLGMNEQRDWYNVRLNDGIEGWLLVALVTVSNRTTVPTLSAAEMTRRSNLPTQVVSSNRTPISGGSSREPGVRARGDVLVYCDKPGSQGETRQTFPSGTSITLWWSWFARTPEQLDDHIQAAQYEIRVDDLAVGNWQDFRTSVIQKAGNYWVYWYVPIGRPPVGEHRIDYKLTWTRKISDGYQTFGPGGELESDSGTCAFTIQ